MAERPESETRNVLVSAVIIGGVVMLFSISVLWILTKNFYLDAYYTIETFFAAPNTAASFDLASLAFSYAPLKFVAVVSVVILDNISNMLVVSFVIAAVLDIIRYANLENFINRFRASRMNGHVIVCGYNEVAAGLINRLVEKKIRVIVVDTERETESVLNRRRILNITGKFTDSDELRLASISKAKEIVFASSSDIDNLLGAITAKKLNERIKILARVSSDEIRTKMYRVGVEMCVLPEYLAGVELGENLVAIAKGGK
ncbi:MAG: NAD-binding protein [Candidatus Micrarchaeota archaeon]|nr:NAD-binding protein [Candidatus Micrarchaeota archaeon]MDE1804756.1 NAD-binding protein [Candidatus Micrarchaeota archaeon]